MFHQESGRIWPSVCHLQFGSVKQQASTNILFSNILSDGFYPLQEMSFGPWDTPHCELFLSLNKSQSHVLHHLLTLTLTFKNHLLHQV